MYVRLSDIERAARDFSAKSKTLRNYHEQLNSEIDAIKSKYLEDIKAASIEAGESYQMLLTLINDASDLFKDKQSMTIAGVTFGYRKKTGKIEIPKEEYTIEKIKEMYGEAADAYLNTKVSVVKKAIDKLPADVLQKLGISITSNSLEAFVKLTDDEVQKLIEAMIKESAKVAE